MPTTKPYKQRTGRYERSQRKRALEIVKATRRYSAPFRTEVQDALTNWPHKIPMLLVEAERMEQRPGARKSRKPLTRSKLRSTETYAERLESLMDQYAFELLDPRMAERAQFVGEILIDVSNEAGVFVSHRALVAAYFMALEHSGRSRAPFVSTAMRHTQQILDGCDAETWQHIQDFWSDDPAKYGPAREKDHCFSWHRKHFKGAKTLNRDRGQSNATPIDLSDLESRRDSLQAQLRFLDHLPENESARFKINSELETVQREIAAAEEWPDVIGGDV